MFCNAIYIYIYIYTDLISQDILMKLNLEFLWQKVHSISKGLFLLAHWT